MFVIASTFYRRNGTRREILRVVIFKITTLKVVNSGNMVYNAKYLKNTLYHLS